MTIPQICGIIIGSASIIAFILSKIDGKRLEKKEFEKQNQNKRGNRK